MRAEGLLFVSRAKPTFARADDGSATLLITCVDRIAQHQVEPWTLIWKGPEAEAFWTQHAAKLTPGTPLHTHTTHLRAHTTGRTVEITARVQKVSFAPRSTEATTS